MPIGDDAASAGMDVVNPLTDLVKDGADEITKTRDYIAQRTSAVQPVAKGGTGATNAADARTNLDVRARLFAVGSDGLNDIKLVWEGSRLGVRVDATDPGDLAFTGDFAGRDAQIEALQADMAGKASLGADVSFGNIFTPAGRSTPVTTSWVAAALNADGRIGIQPSALRFKKNIRDMPWDEERTRAFLAILDRVYQLRAFIEGTPSSPDQFGWIAEEVIAAGFDDLVVFDDDGEPLSINYSQAVVHLHAVAKEQQARLDAIDARLAALEAPDAV